jgi:CelD/BcsL family acetyltransferase involved in cellulose biosynthesis
MADPHLTADWLALLERTALPHGTEVIRVPVGPRGKPHICHLPLMRLAATPWRVESLATFYSPIAGPVDGCTADAGGLHDVFDRIRRAKQQPTAVIDLAPLCPQSPFFAAALTALRQSGWLVGRYFRFGNWHATVGEPSFAAYLAERPSALRNTVRRARRKLERQAAARLFIHTELDDTLEPAIADFQTVYGRSWKQPEPYPQFIPELCRLAAVRGWLRLGLIRIQGRPVAAQIWLVEDGRAQIVKLAYDGSRRSLSVGTLLTAELMRHAIERDRVTEIDYLMGDDAYKRDWTPQRRERHGIIAFNPRQPRGLVLAARHLAGVMLKRRGSH